MERINQDIERRMAEMRRYGRCSEGMFATSAVIQQKNRELQWQLEESEKRKSASGRVTSTASAVIHQKNQELERKIAELERSKSTGRRVMSSASVALMQKNAELERKFAGLLDSEHKTATLSTSRQEKVNTRVIQLKRLIAASQELDLAFLVDATGSMQPFINSVMEKTPSIAAGVKRTWPQLKLRVAFAPYRDYKETAMDDGETCDFTDDFAGRDSVFVKALSRVRVGIVPYFSHNQQCVGIALRTPA